MANGFKDYDFGSYRGEKHPTTSELRKRIAEGRIDIAELERMKRKQDKELAAEKKRQSIIEKSHKKAELYHAQAEKKEALARKRTAGRKARQSIFGSIKPKKRSKSAKSIKWF